MVAGLKAALAVAILWLVLRKVDLSSAWQMTANQNYWWVGAAYFICFLQIGLGGLRWRIAMRALGGDPPLWDTLKLFYVSIFFNTWVPGGVGGDVMRAWLSYRAKISAKVAITSVILDRMAALVGIAVLVLLSMPAFLERAGYGMTAFLPIALSMIGLVGVLMLALLHRMPASWLRIRPLQILRDFGFDVRTVFLHPLNGIPLLLVAMVSQAALGVATYAMATSLGITVSMLECVVLMQPVALIANLPLTIGGWGIRETAMIAIFGLVGVPAAATLALSVQLGILMLLIALPGGLLWLVMKPSTSRNGEAGGQDTPAGFAHAQNID